MTDVLTLNPDPSSIVFTFATDSPGCTWHLCAVQAHDERSSWSARPTRGASGHDMLSPRLMTALQDLIADLSGPQIVSLPDHVISLPGLTLGRARIIARTDESGGITALIRFVRVIGDPRAVLRDVAERHSMQNEREELATRVLVDLVQPCLDLAAAADLPQVTENADLIRARLDRLDAHQEELAFLARLLQSTLRRDDSENPLPASGGLNAISGGR